jgi:Sulfotransferase family
MPQNTGPDFICVGMPKAGTGWLYDQLQYHPDFWMPPIKELHYLDRDIPRMKNADRLLQRWGKRSEKASGFRRPWDERDRQFLLDTKACGGLPMDLGRYASLYRHKNGSLSGDISPGYSRLPDDVVRKLAAELPAIKVILLIRDPVARTWSRISMAHRDGKFDTGLLEDDRRFMEFLETSSYLRDRSHPTQILDRWQRCAPNMAFRHYLFDDIEGEPERIRRDILTFLGADPDKQSGQLAAGHNRKANAAKLVMTDNIRGLLVRYFHDEILACAARLGGAAESWPQRYGLQPRPRSPDA